MMRVGEGKRRRRVSRQGEVVAKMKSRATCA